jgi:murein DD-endopeptidase MepM/ murein hydrolase activator NlpD
MFATSCMQSPAVVENKSGTYKRNSGYNGNAQVSDLSQDSFHMVKQGDTLYSISRIYGVDVNSLIQQNNLVEPYVIKKGMNLKISGSSQSYGGEVKFVDSGAETGFGGGQGETFPSESKSSPVFEKDLGELTPLKPLQPKIITDYPPIIIDSKESIKAIESKEMDTDSEELILPNEVKINSLDNPEKIEKPIITKSSENLALKDAPKSQLHPIVDSEEIKEIESQEPILPNEVKVNSSEISEEIAEINTEKSPEVLASNDFPKPSLRPTFFPKPSLRPGVEVENDKKVAYMDASYQTEVPNDEKPKNVSARGFAWPTKGKIISKFGAKNGGLYNDGINISAKEGASVIAADNGAVVYAGNELRGYGNMILIKHSNGYVTAYAHNNDLFVKKGDIVEKGQKIASVGSTGHVSKPQLHFSIRKGRKAIDPQVYLPKS